MKIGITYDTGVFPGGRESRPVFRREQVELDMKVIGGDLGCAAVRVTGSDLERLAVAANCAADAGLEVWMSPFPCEQDADAMLTFFEESAAVAEELRNKGRSDVVFVAGCEASVFGRGFLPGEDAYARLRLLSAPTPELFAEYPQILARFQTFLADAAAVARSKFSGPITYASGQWEQVDWTRFDIVGVDAYRDQTNRDAFEGEIAALQSHGKPVAITEFGCCTYSGAGERGASGWMIVEGEDDQRRLAGDYVRDEGEQVRYLRELLEIFERNGVDSAFWFTFASWNRPQGQGPRKDLDVSSFGVVRVVDDRAASPSDTWRPKAVFEELARAGRAMSLRAPAAAGYAARMTTPELANQFVSMCKEGKNFDVMQQLYADDIVSVEAVVRKTGSLETKGKAAVIQKSAEWAAAHEIHGATVEGPFVLADEFAVVFEFDVTPKATGQRVSNREIAVYTVADGLITQEKFYYGPGANALAR